MRHRPEKSGDSRMICHWPLPRPFAFLATAPQARIAAAVSLVAVIASSEASFAAGDAAHGEKLYQMCKGCHVPGKNTVGPMHDGVYGSKAGAIAGYTYSPALKNSGIVWNDETLDTWLTNPQAFIPGSK